MCNPGPNELDECKTLKHHVPTVAEELREISRKTKTMTQAERTVNAIIEEAKAIAETTGGTELKKPLMTEQFFIATKDRLEIPTNKTIEEFAKELYNSQKEAMKMLEDKGFKVTVTKPDLPSILDISLDAQTKRMIEYQRMSMEGEITVSWG